MRLIVFNYSMNRTSQVFSHQRMVVEKLSSIYQSIDVITSEKFLDQPIPGVNIYSLNWALGKNVRNFFRFYFVALPLLVKHRRGVLFSHMTHIQSLLVAPLCRLLHIRHILWYAHKSNSFYLRFAFPFLNNVVTSTAGSCPLTGPKVKIIGQAVDVDFYIGNSKPAYFPPKRWLTIGRIDPSKNLEEIILEFALVRKEIQNLSLDIFGKPSSEENLEYYSRLIRWVNNLGYSDWIKFKGYINHSEIEGTLLNYDGFAHAFRGSLDKALLEAIALKRFVVSSNHEYLDLFHTHSLGKKLGRPTLAEQIRKAIGGPETLTRDEIDFRWNLTRNFHSLENWLNSLLPILQFKTR